MLAIPSAFERMLIYHIVS